MLTKIILFTVFVTAMVMMAFTRSGQKKKIIFFGDSITELGVKPKGYIKLIDALFQDELPETKVELIGSGISGDKVYDLYLRMDADVISKSPDITVVYIGVNDVWHKKLAGTGTDEVKFEKFYKAIIVKLLAIHSKVILCTPAVIGEKKEHANALDADLNKYSNIIRKLANEYQLPLVDLRNDFCIYYNKFNPDNLEKNILTYDGVHLNDAGNQLVAAAIWQELKKMISKKLS